MDQVTRRTKAFIDKLAEVIRERREGAGMSQTELAARAGLSQPSIAMIEAGNRSPTLDTLSRLAQSMGTTVSSMCAEAEGRVGPGRK